MQKVVNVHGTNVVCEKLDVPDCLPDRLHNFVTGNLDDRRMGTHLRTVSDRLANLYYNRYKYRNKILHLSDVNTCLLSSWLKRRYPDWLEQFPEKTWEKKMHLMRGSILSVGLTSLFATSEKGVSFPLPGVDASLTGRLDFAAGGILWELKWSSDFAVRKIRKEGPYPHHIEQVLFYRYCRKYPECRILYWHSHDIDVYRIDLGKNEEIIRNLAERAVKLHEHLKKEKPPDAEPNYAWSCDLCDFSKKTCGDKALCVGGEYREPKEEVAEISEVLREL